MQYVIFNCNSKLGVYHFYYFSAKKTIKMRYIMFLLKILMIYFREKTGFDCKINYKHNKLANFWLYTIDKISCTILIIMSYILLTLSLRKI